MKVIVKENLGAEYASDLISSCNQSGIQAIADYTGNEILFYDPKNWLYGRHSDMMKDASLEDDIFSIFNGKTPELRAKVLKPAKGEDFREFAVEWNNLQKQESPDIIKTKNCSVIRFGAHESGMSRSSMKGEYPAKIEWQVDFPKFGINAGDTEKLVLRFSEIDALAHAHGGNGLDELIEEKMNEKYPGIGQLDYEDDYIITNFEDMCDYHDMYIGKERVYEATRSDGGMDDNVSEWYAERFPDDDLAGRINKQVTFQDVMDCLDYGADIYDLLETGDSTIRERLFAELSARTGVEYGKLYRRWLKNSAFNESIDGSASEVELGDSDFDQLNEYLEDMAQSYWEEDNMGGGGKAEMLTNLYSDVLKWLNDRGFTKHNHSPITLVVDGAQIPARDLASDILDRIYKQNKDNYTGYGESHGDDPRDWSASEDEVEIQWMIDDKELGIVSGSTESFVIDLDLVDCFEELVYQVTKAMEGEYNGMTFGYDDEWIFTDEDKWLKRFGYNMNESRDRLDMGLADWYMTRFPDDAAFAERMDSSSTFQELWEALEAGDDVYSVIGVGDSTVRERLFQRLAELKKMSYGEVYMMWQKSGK